MNPYDRLLARIHAMTDAMERRSPTAGRTKKRHEATKSSHHEAKRSVKKASKHRKVHHR